MTDTTDQLRDRIAQALAAELMPRYGGPQHRTPGGLPLTATAEEAALHRAQPLVDAVLAVLGTTTGQPETETPGRALLPAKEIPLGHSTPSHRVHGWCSHCPGRSVAEELAAWQVDALDRTDEIERLRTENERMRHELEVMYGGAFDKPETAPAVTRATVLRVREYLKSRLDQVAVDPAEIFNILTNPERATTEQADTEAAPVLDRIREVVLRLTAHAVGFQDVLDESDRGPWGKTIGADIAELRRLADEAQQPTPAVAEETTRCARCREPIDLRGTEDAPLWVHRFGNQYCYPGLRASARPDRAPAP